MLGTLTSTLHARHNCLPAYDLTGTSAMHQPLRPYSSSYAVLPQIMSSPSGVCGSAQVSTQVRLAAYGSSEGACKQKHLLKTLISALWLKHLTVHPDTNRFITSKTQRLDTQPILFISNHQPTVLGLQWSPSMRPCLMGGVPGGEPKGGGTWPYLGPSQ